MGWVSILEDALERIQDSIRLSEKAVRNRDEFTDIHRQESLKALNDAQAILVRAYKHLELATTPEIELAHENSQLRDEIGMLEHKLKSAEGAAKKAEYETANYFARLQDANREVADLKKRCKKLEKDFEKVAKDDFGSAVDAYSSPGMIRKHKPNA